MPDEATPATTATATAAEAASCNGVVKIYWTATGEVHAVKGIDARFPGGAITAVVGPSGSGKSSLLRILACIDRPTAGQVMVGPLEVSSLGPRKRRKVRRRHIGYVFQRPSDNLVSYLTAREHLELSARLRGFDLAAEGDRLLEILGLSGSLRDEGTAFAISTHDAMAVRMADRTLYLRHGALEAEAHFDRALSVIDQSGRIQLPPKALRMFPDRRAVITIDEGEVRITPP